MWRETISKDLLSDETGHGIKHEYHIPHVLRFSTNAKVLELQSMKKILSSGGGSDFGHSPLNPANLPRRTFSECLAQD